MIKNPMLQQSMASIEKSVTDRESFDRIVKAGDKVIYNQEMFKKLVQGIDEAEDPIKEVADGMVGILGLLYQKSRNTMPITPMVQAGMALLIDALDFLEQAGMAEVGPDELSRATRTYIDSLLPKFGMTPDKITALMNQVGGTLNDPQRMEQIKQQKGGAK